MRKFLAVLVILFSLPASVAVAQPATSKGTALTEAQAKQFYQNCVMTNQPGQEMKAQTKDVYCQCTAIHMRQSITMEDIKATMGNDQAARNAINKTLTKVHAPCMEYPVRDLIAAKCTKDVGVTRVCNCLSDKMGGYVAREAQRLLGGILASNPNITDPMGAIMDTKEFKDNEQRLTMSCAQMMLQ